MNPLFWLLRSSGFARASAFAWIAAAGTLAVAANRGGPESEWVHPGRDGKLIYKTTPAGDRIMDFSHAGYMGGGVALPYVPVRRTVQPSGGEDDTAAIQAAINEVAALPLIEGFRGAVLLAPGTFPCSNTITIPVSGVVLRGSGSGADGAGKSTIRMTGSPHTAIVVRGPGVRGGRGDAQSPADSRSQAAQRFEPAETHIAAAYVPSGASAFVVADATGFAVGDTIEIRRPVTEAWIRFMEMHDLVRDGRPQTWIRAGNTTIMERQIAAISGHTITVDVPLSDSFDAKYLNPPGTAVVKVRPPVRVEQSGIEHLHIASPPQAISHSERHFTAIRMNGRDCWMRDVVCDETMNSVGVGGKRITLERVAVNRAARHQGSSRPAEFAPNGEQILMDRCSVNADNVWFVATGGGHSGPIVVLNGNFVGTSRAESHQRWSTGMLYDNCRATNGAIEFRNRGSMGSGHGWSMGWGVAWNCEAADYIVQNPPGAANWLIGCMGETSLKPRPFGDGPNLAEGIKDSHGRKVTPESLYLAQLEERLGPQAVKNIGYSLKWTKRQFFAGPFENATTADLNKDGQVDIVYGPYWFAGPDFVPRAYRPQFIVDAYHRNNSDHVLDVDQDGWPDIIAGYWDTAGIWWYRNPGNAPSEQGRGWEMHNPWQAQQLAATRGRMEMFVLHDYDADGRPELHSACYAKQEVLEIWRWTTNAEGKPALAPFVLGAEGGGHGIAFGDVNGDGREDVLCEIGWYERPEGDPFAAPWKLHRETDLSKMHPSCPFVVKDLNEDGRLDIIFGRGHAYGLYWWEQLEPKPDGTTQWKQHVIDESWSQAHALELADLDGDGHEELVAGKCIWAHNAGDPGAADPPAIYYYKWNRAASRFSRHTIAAPGEGIALGRQFSVTDLNGDGRPDILAPSKHSFWVLFNQGYGSGVSP